MKHVVMAWEIGGGLGHVGKLNVLAWAYAHRGWKVSLVLKDVASASAFAWPPGTQAWPAPRAGEPGRMLARLMDERRSPPVNMSALMVQGQGWTAKSLAASLGRWRELLVQLSPDLLLMDYAPVGMWAGRLARVPVVNAGVCISVPLLGAPMPPLRWWQGPQRAACEAADRALLEMTAQAATLAAVPPLADAAQLWEADFNALCTLPILDVGALQGRPRTCLGLVEKLSDGSAPRWPDGDGPRVFAYLARASRVSREVLQVLERSRARVLVVMPGELAGETAQVVAGLSSRVRVSSRPVNLAQAFAEAELCVTLGNHGTTAQALCHGVPVLAIPDTLERAWNAMGAQKAGGARVVLPSEVKGALLPMLEHMLTTPSYQSAARAVAMHPLSRLSAVTVANQLLDEWGHLA